MKKIFIVGSGRSGTNFLGKALQSALSAHNFVEQRYLWSGISPLSERITGYSTWRKVRIKRHFSNFSHGYSAVIDKTPGNLFRVASIVDLFPEARFIFVVRNPLDNIDSRRRLLMPEQSKLQSLLRLIRHLKTLIIRGNLPIDRLPAFITDQFLLLILRKYLNINLLGKMERVDDQVEAFRSGGNDAVFVNQLLKSEEEFRRLEDSQKIIMVRYEDLYLDTAKESMKISEFLSMSEEESTKFIKYIEENGRPETIRLNKNIQSTLPNLPSDWQSSLKEYMVRLEYESFDRDFFD